MGVTSLSRRYVHDDHIKVLHRLYQRLKIVRVFFFFFFLLIVVRLIDIMGLSPQVDQFLKIAESVTASMKRKDIVDRNGILLATNLTTASLYAQPFQIKNPEEVGRKILEILPQLSREEVMAKLASDKKFVWIARNLSPQDQSKIYRLGVPGLNFHREEKRVYPHGALLAHVLGFTDVDNHGIGGIEHQFNQFLTHSSSGSLMLSIDLRIQHILYDEIKKSIDHFKAQGGAGLVLNVKTGEVLGMVSFPDFDPNLPKEAKQESFFNKNTLGVYEMGSAFKLFTVAMALEHGTATLASQYDATVPLRVSRFQIKDFKPQNRKLSVSEIIQHSSNIGSSKMALEVGVERQRAFFEKLGFLQACSLEIPEVGKPMIPQQWRDINLMTISYGYGLSISPLQLASGLGSMVNGGIVINPTLLKRNNDSNLTSQRIISETTSHDIRKLMRLVVTEGTGRKANVPGFFVGGKTSTAEVLLAGGKGYNHSENLSSFLCVFPMNDPQYMVMVMIDRPIATTETFGYSTGGWTSAPTAGNVAKRMGTLLGLPLVNENDPKLQEDFRIPGKIYEAKNQIHRRAKG